MNLLISILGRLFSLVLAVVPVRQFEALVNRSIAARAGTLPPDEALRFLFRIDAFLYALQGQKSMAYGDGVHTKHRHIRYHDFFVERIQQGDKVLDLGCGRGELAADIAERAGGDVLAIDMNAESIAVARSRYDQPGLEFAVGEAFSDLPRRAFDVVVLSNVLEHLPGRPAFLRRIIETIRPGRILIRVPLFERDWRVPLKKELGVEWRLDPTHETEYTVESFSSELAEAGLTVKDQRICWGEIWAEAVPAYEISQAEQKDGER